MAVFRDFCRMLKSALVALVLVFTTFGANATCTNGTFDGHYPYSQILDESKNGQAVYRLASDSNSSELDSNGLKKGEFQITYDYGKIKGSARCYSQTESVLTYYCFCNNRYKYSTYCST